MDLAGVIAAEADPPGIDRARWLALIGERPELLASNEEGIAEVVVDGQAIGRMLWSRGGANEIDVRADAAVVADPEALSDIAWNVASALGGRFITLREMMSC